MKKLSNFIVLLAMVVCLPSCEGCVKKASKKATELGLSVVEGVSEALDEHGARVSEKATDAMGQIVSGAGRSIDRLLNEHAETVTGVAGRTLVQSFEGFSDGIATEFYDKIENVSIVASDSETVAAVEFIGKITSRPVVDAYLIIDGAGTFTLDFVFENSGGGALMTKSVEATVDPSKKHTVVSFALSSEEEVGWDKTVNVNIKLTLKGDI